MSNNIRKSRSPHNINLNVNDIVAHRSPSPRPPAGRNLGKELTIQIKIEFDKLQFVKNLGHGRHGTVAKYKHTPTNLEFAMKRISSNRNDDDPNENKYILRDLEALNKTGDTPYTIKFYGAFFSEGDYWILTECMDLSLDKFYSKAHLLNKPPNEAFVSKVAYTILKAMEHLKTKDIIHRDVKPSNVLINHDGTIKLCDFGISGFLRNSVAETYIGCQPYMSPEKIIMTGYRIESDIWSLGISLVEIFTGVHPYHDCKTLSSQTEAIINRASPKLSSEKYTADACSFIDLCLIKDPESRGHLEQLLKHPFIKSHEKIPVDVQYVKEIIDSHQQK